MKLKLSFALLLFVAVAILSIDAKSLIPGLQWVKNPAGENFSAANKLVISK